MTDGPLRAVRVLDLTHVWAGPLGVRVLADLGAEVVKVEAPSGRGPRDVVETPLGGWLWGDPGDEPWNRNAMFLKLMRNRRALCIDLKTAAGRTTFLELVARADVVIENFSARAMPALGLDYATLASVNPRIVYVTLSGYGTFGPYRDRVAFGPTVEPLSGLDALHGYGPGESRCSSMALLDPIAALSTAAAVLTALRRREATGSGARVELCLHEAGVSFSGPWLIEHQLGGQIAPMGNRHPAMAPHGVYPSAGADAWIAIGCASDAEWRALCRVVQSPNLDPALGLAARRGIHNLIDDAIAAWTRVRDRHAATLELQAAGVSAGPVNTTPDMLADAQVLARRFFVPLDEGMPMPGNPIRMAGLTTEDWTPCPRLGADNAAVLADWLGYAPERIAALESQGILANQPPA
jgi:crotonobetainyl-CoA:carnitine CoA-transferase CaiB-like acyl-CoA transferase